MRLPGQGGCWLLSSCSFNLHPSLGIQSLTLKTNPLPSGWVTGHDSSLPNSRNTPPYPCHGLVAGRVIFPTHRLCQWETNGHEEHRLECAYAALTRTHPGQLWPLQPGPQKEIRDR